MSLWQGNELIYRGRILALVSENLNTGRWHVVTNVGQWRKTFRSRFTAVRAIERGALRVRLERVARVEDYK